MRHARAAVALLVVSLGCALGLWWGFHTKLDYWDVKHFVLLLYGGLLSATLASALAWRHDHGLIRIAPRLVASTMVLVWARTWCEPLEWLAAWLSKMRYLWLEV